MQNPRAFNTDPAQLIAADAFWGGIDGSV